MADFEGFEGQTTPQPSKNQFWARSGVNAQPAGDAPPADNTTFRRVEPKRGKTTAAFVKTVN